MSNSTSTINWAKPAAFASVITGKQIKVVPGNPAEGPHIDGRKITIGSAINWDEDDRFAVLVHECCHNIFPANYPGGNIRELANLIDDCRIERQFLVQRPHYEDVLASLAINVIANGIYDTESKDRWSAEHFDPALWALLFFRPHCGEEVRLAASDAINAYAERKGLAKVAGWQEKFAAVVEEAQRITRLKTVSKDTLEKWCIAYFDCFPEAKKNANSVMSVAILSDQPAPKGEQEDSEGQGDAKADVKIRVKSGAGKPSEGKPTDGEDEDGEEDDQEGDSEGDEGDEAQDKPQGEKPSQKGNKGGQKGQDKGDGEAKGPADLEEALERLKAACGEVGQTKKAAAQENTQAEAAASTKEDPQVEMDEEVHGGIGNEKGTIEARKIGSAVDRNFTNRVKMSIRKLRTLIIDRIAGHKKVGRLHLPTVIAAEKKGILPRKPFISSIEDLVDAPVACVVATDFSGSTTGYNAKLNDFSHNALYALQSAGCECTEVVWNSGASITKGLDDQVSAVRANQHNSDGGTSLVACSQGCIESLKRSKAQRKVAFVFTDGAVYENEVPMLSENLRRNGFEACLLVALGERVKPSGIVDTELCSDINALVGIFDRWVRKQAAKAAQSQYA